MSKDLYFSIHTDKDVKDANGSSGYSYGYYKIIEHFSNFTHNNKKLNVLENSPTASVQMFYMEPERHIFLKNNDGDVVSRNVRSEDFRKFSDHQYKILGTHLETTRVWSHWIDSMNKVDEIWVGNYFARDAVVNSGITTPTYVFEHGIDDMWKPFLRGQNSKIRFLHVDSGSPRKRADLVEKAFREVFGNSQDVSLTMKYRPGETDEGFDVMNLFNQNVFKIHETLSDQEMLQLYYNHDVLVYPSEGEGFGFIPLQALATGMPVISTSRWCSYEKYLGQNIIESTIGPTKSTGYFEGEVILPEYDSLTYLMRKVYDDIDSQCQFYYNQAEKVIEEYNWQSRCNKMLASFIKRVGIKTLYPNEKYLNQLPIQIKYVGNGYYSTRSGVQFSKNDRIHYVPMEEYDALIQTENFVEIG
jgi:glycosyltransferase involved in cell wall biosynthesis